MEEEKKEGAVSKFFRENDGKIKYSLIDFDQWILNYTNKIYHNDVFDDSIESYLTALILNFNWFNHVDISYTHYQVLSNLKTLSYNLAIEYGFGDAKIKGPYLKPFTPLAKVLMHGAIKYEIDNWKKESDDILHCVDSALRHIAELQEGNLYDLDSSEHHIGHIMANIMFLSYHL